MMTSLQILFGLTTDNLDVNVFNSLASQECYRCLEPSQGRIQKKKLRGGGGGKGGGAYNI